MVFHAADDSNVPVQQSRDFVERMKVAGKDATFVEVPAGDHYDSMIEQGIPRGIEWMKRGVPSLVREWRKRAIGDYFLG